MTINKLLTGAAVAALLSGAALAQDNVTAATGDLRTDRDFAAEYDGAIGAEAIFIHDFNHADYLGLGGAAELDITVLSGGGIGNSSVTYRTTGTPNACDGDNTFSLDLTRTAANAGQDSGATVTVVCNSDCGVFADESDSFTLIDETSAFPLASRVVTPAGAAITLDVDGIGPIGAKTLGNVSYEFDGTNIFTDTDGAAIGNVAAATVILAVASAELVIDFPAGDDGILGVSVNAGGAVACTEDAGAAVSTWTCTLTATELAALDAGGDVSFTVDNVDAVAQQTPTAALTVTSNANYSAPSGPSGSLAAIEWDDGLGEVPVASGGTTDWVRFGTGGTESNFRIQMKSAAAAAAVTQVRVTVGEEGNGIAADTYILPAGTVDTGFVVNGATVTFNSRALGVAAGGASGNANITGISLQGTDADIALTLLASADVDRQMVNRSPSSYVATGGLTGN